MDDEFLEKMESFWFFSSVFKPSSHITTQNVEMSTKQNWEVEKQMPAKEQTQIDFKVKEGYKCKEKASPEKRRGKRKGMRSKERVQKWIQQSSPPAVVKLEQRTPFSVIYDSQLGIIASNGRIVPRVRDDLEMKAQIRSWAYAVACSVR